MNTTPTTGYQQHPHIRSLDGIRAIAAIMVVLFHSPIPIFQCAFGWAGVNLFFILSGFLITRILLSNRERPFLPGIRSFYGRRAARIFPLYFFYLLLTASILFLFHRFGSGKQVFIDQGISDLHINYPFLLTFTYNFEELINFIRGKPYLNSFFFGHLWTLSVEVQFYFLFPIFFRLIPLKWLKRLMLIIIILVPFIRLFVVTWLVQRVNDLFWIGDMLYVSTPFQFDSLALGIYIALIDPTRIPKVAGKVLVALLIILLLLGAVHLHLLKGYGLHPEPGSLGFDNPVFHVIYRTPLGWLNNRYFYSYPLINITFGLAFILVANRQLFPWAFENRYLVNIGRVSYGIYIYHLSLSFYFTLAITSIFGREIQNFNLLVQCLLMIVYLGILFVMAWLSYSIYERRWLNLVK